MVLVLLFAFLLSWLSNWCFVSRKGALLRWFLLRKKGFVYYLYSCHPPFSSYVVLSSLSPDVSNFYLYLGRAQRVAILMLVQGAMALDLEVAVSFPGVIDGDLCAGGDIGLRH